MGPNPSIQSSSLDGTSREILVTDVRFPIVIKIDYPARRLYWIDGRRHTIETVLLTGQDRHVVKNFTSG